MSNGAFVAPIDSAPEIICDAGPLIHLGELGCIDLLSDFGLVYVPDQVWREVARHRPAALDTKILKRVDIELSTDVHFQTLVRTLALDLGEQAALSLIKMRRKAILLTDDAAARMAAKAMGVRSHGTIAVLLRAIRRKQRDRAEVLRLLKAIPSVSTLHIRGDLLTKIIEDVEN